MDALILAGGFGTRLHPLTLAIPKPLIPVGNVPIVRRLIDKLPRDVRKVVVAANYRVDDLRAYFRANDCGREVVVIDEAVPLGTAGAIKNAERELDGPFFVLNGDILDSLDLAAFRDAHRRERALASISLWEVADPRAFGVVALDGARITRFVEKPATLAEAPSRLVNAGTYLFEPDVLDAIPAGRAVSIERETFPALLARGARLVGFPFTGRWIDCGRVASLLAANAALAQEAGMSRFFASNVEDRGATVVEWAVVDAGSWLGAGVRLERAVLSAGCSIGENVTLRDTVLGEGVVVESDASLVRCVLAAGARARKGAQLEGVAARPGEVVGGT
ncbi:MAG: nucleotidyltransferase family protein [Thermoplasmatota archaeon]